MMCGSILTQSENQLISTSNERSKTQMKHQDLILSIEGGLIRSMLGPWSVEFYNDSGIVTLYNDGNIVLTETPEDFVRLLGCLKFFGSWLEFALQPVVDEIEKTRPPGSNRGVTPRETARRKESHDRTKTT